MTATVDESSISANPNAIPRMSRWTPVGVLILYAIALAAATWPYVTTFASELPSLGDPIAHLWTMRWYQHCLLEGRSPFYSPDIQYPIGAALGYLPPLQYQSLLFLLFTLINPNEILTYNLIWASGFLLTGFGTFVLAWHLTRHQGAAAVAGLVAMLSGPMMLHGHAHLEQITLGWFPLFLVAWMRLIDQPSRGRLMGALTCNILMCMSAPYFVVLGVIPALLYVLYRSIQVGRSGLRAWLRMRIGWLLAFSGSTVVLLMLLFAPQLWVMAQGESLSRDRLTFDAYGSPFWTYWAPTSLHWLARFVMPFDPYAEAGMAATIGERASYLGLVTIALLYYALLRFVRFPKAGYWWALLAVLVVLSMGSACWIGTQKVELPASWLWKVFPPMRLIRVPARFNLFAAVVASVIAASALKELLGRFHWRMTRAVVVLGVMLIAVADLAMVPFGSAPPPERPACYDFLKRIDPDARIVEAPLFSSGSHYYAIRGYWQFDHGLSTTAGYTAHRNARFDDRVLQTAPVSFDRLTIPDGFDNPTAMNIDMLTEVDFHSYVWLYLHSLGFDYLVLHHWDGSPLDYPLADVARIKELLRPAIVFEDDATTVFARSKLEPPRHPTPLGGDGWRASSNGLAVRVATESAELVVFNPDPAQPLTLALAGRSFRRPRTVLLKIDDTILATWQIVPRNDQLYVSPPFHLPQGVSRVVLESDGEATPKRRAEAAKPGDMAPYSLLVNAVCLRPSQPEEIEVHRIASKSEPAR